MYIWIGCKLPQAFEQELRGRCAPLGESLRLDMVGFTLPQHISLKISFEAEERYETILDFVEQLLKKEEKFYVNLLGLERMGNILWLSFRENETLRRLHDALDRELETRFAICQHPFDRDFAFHSTLFFGEEEKLSRAMDALSDYPLPSQLPIETFLLGVSKSGKAGTYRVVRQVDVLK